MAKQIWFDMTTSMQWTGGVVGIVRAELEVAKNLHALNKDIKFCLENNGHIEEINVDSLSWLWETEDVTADYLKNRPNNSIKNNGIIENILNQDEAQRNSGIGRSARLKRASLMGISVLPKHIQGISLLLAYLPLKLVDITSFIFRRLSIKRARSTISIENPVEILNSLRLSSNDVIVSMGWMDSQKETVFEMYKKEFKLKLVYLVYDLILINNQTSHLYNKIGSEKFKKYFEWISQHCDFLLFGGETAKRDTLSYQKLHHLRSPAGQSVKFGSDIIKVKKENSESDKGILSKLGVTDDFIITVGSIEARKNHDVLYKAYAILNEKKSGNIPKLIIIGRPSYRSEELVDNIKRDPRVKDSIILLTPSDEELDCLYRNCLFTLLPSFYEGWSLTLPESFGYGKLCLAADVPPLREIGDGLTEFINIYDPFAWAKKIDYYANNKNEIKNREVVIKQQWENTTWLQCAEQINKIIAQPDFLIREDESTYETLWYDLTTSYVRWRGGVSGIIRSELILAKEILQSNINVKFFGYYNGKIFIIPHENLKIIFDAPSIEEGYRHFQSFWSYYESAGSGNRIPNDLIKPSENPIIFPELQDSYNFSNSRRNRLFHSFILLSSVLPKNIGNFVIKSLYALKTKTLGRSKVLPTEVKATVNNELKVDTSNSPFQNGDQVLSVGIDWTTELLQFITEAKKTKTFKFTQVIYDLTPVITPHLHAEENSMKYHNFLESVAKASDQIIFGGATAQRDAHLYFKEHDWPIECSDYIKFGSDIVSTKSDNNDGDDEILKKLEIEQPFILTVGTIEIRKNHETLYKTYLNLLDKDQIPPLLIIAGKPGWKISSFLESLQNDLRVRKYIRYISPSDSELDVLYRRCMFTVLSSMYEGWSLTLPESLSYGKVCITSDVDPLREVGEGLVPFVHPWNVEQWGDEIIRLFKDENYRTSLEQKIHKNWKSITWQDCAKSLVTKIGLHVPE
ncbi:glycosyltransferase [Pantoea sp.]|uniref:glycosyltransferase n=1 Tax=Pantoea sp. TaxID=69393 RepID=UPI0031D2C064